MKSRTSVFALGAAALSAALSLLAVGRMMREGIFEGQGSKAVIATAIPIVLAALAVIFVAKNRKRGTWIVAVLFLAFVTVTAFSLGLYFWFAAGAAVVAAIVLQLSKDRDINGNAFG